jgi:ABC-type transport system involved in multi-copper enzyme maturation permease subunit
MSQPTTEARVHDLRYQPYQGQLGSVQSRFWVIAMEELRKTWKSKWFRRLVWLSFFPIGIFAVLFVMRSRFPEIFPVTAQGLWFSFWVTQLSFSVLMVFHTGRKAVGEDIRSGAMTVYFSRPVDFKQYLFGKWLAVAGSVLGVTLGPGFVLSLLEYSIDSQATLLQLLMRVGSLVLLSGMLCMVLGWSMLAVSAVAGKGRAAGIGWFIFLSFTNGPAEALAHATQTEALGCLGITKSTMYLVDYLFAFKFTDPLLLWSLAGQAFWVLVSMAVLIFRLRSWRRQ